VALDFVGIAWDDVGAFTLRHDYGHAEARRT
jgi:hypothetical protein